MNRERVERALSAAIETQAMRLGPDTLEQSGKLFKELFPGKKALIIADANTYEVAGKFLHEVFAREGIAMDNTVILDPEGLYAEFAYVDMLDAVMAGTDATPVAVGSGTINDLVKLSSHRNGRRYMCVATAASMDGYTAYGASITYKGSKQTFDCPAPLAVVADTRIIAAAPAEMTAAGYADLSAKITAGADWILSDTLGVEELQDDIFQIVQDGLDEALGDPCGVISGDPDKMEPLIEGLLLGGFAMQAAQTSRPASGAEHQFSHLWDMEHHKFKGKSPSHGFKVSIGTLASTALYEMLLAEDIANLDIERTVSKWPSLGEAKANALKMFEGTDFPELGAVETEAKYSDKDELTKHLNSLKENWVVVREKLRRQLLPFGELKSRLEAAGAPVCPEQIGISRERLRASFLRAQHLRRRFTILDLAVRLGKLEEWLDAIFEGNGLWPLK